MDGKQKAVAARIYQDFEPPTELSSENDSDTILVYVPGFQKGQLKVQLSKSRELIISGERLVEDNTWQRFRKTVAVSPNCDTERITAKFKFEDQILYIIQPKLIASEKNEDHEKLVKGAGTPESRKPVDEKKQPDIVKDESRQKPAVVTNPNLSTYETDNAAANGETALKKVKEEVRNDRKSGESSDYKPWDPDSDNLSCKMNERANKSLGLATTVKVPRHVINLVLAVLLAIALGLYVKNSASFWKKDEN